jgi:hypothetical protein
VDGDHAPGPVPAAVEVGAAGGVGDGDHAAAAAAAGHRVQPPAGLVAGAAARAGAVDQVDGGDGGHAERAGGHGAQRVGRAKMGVDDVRAHAGEVAAHAQGGLRVEQPTHADQLGLDAARAQARGRRAVVDVLQVADGEVDVRGRRALGEVSQ